MRLPTPSGAAETSEITQSYVRVVGVLVIVKLGSR